MTNTTNMNTINTNNLYKASKCLMEEVNLDGCQNNERRRDRTLAYVAK